MGELALPNQGRQRVGLVARIDNQTGRQEYGRTFRLGQSDLLVDASTRLRRTSRTRASRALGRLHLSIFVQEPDFAVAKAGGDVALWQPPTERFERYDLEPISSGTAACIGSHIIAKSLRQFSIAEDVILQTTAGVEAEHMVIELNPSTAYPHVLVTDVSRQGIAVVPE